MKINSTGCWSLDLLISLDLINNYVEEKKIKQKQTERTMHLISLMLGQIVPVLNQLTLLTNTKLTAFFFCSFSNSNSFICMASEIVGNCES